MLDGVRVNVTTYSPTLENQVTRPARATISDDAIEFDNVEFFDIAGDPYGVVAARMDFSGATLSYEIIDRSYSQFANVDDETGFNGYVFDFGLGRAAPGVMIRDARIVEGLTTLAIPDDNVSQDANSLFVNVDGLRFTYGSTLTVRLGFQVKGDAGRDWLTGAEGNDVLLGQEGRDMLFGDGGRDRLFGGRGDDLLAGGFGRDTLIGGAGADQFVLESRGGVDRVTDFDPSHDRILVSTGAQAFSDLQITVRGEDIDIESGGAHLILLDIARSEVTSDLFLF